MALKNKQNGTYCLEAQRHISKQAFGLARKDLSIDETFSDTMVGPFLFFYDFKLRSSYIKTF